MCPNCLKNNNLFIDNIIDYFVVFLSNNLLISLETMDFFQNIIKTTVSKVENLSKSSNNETINTENDKQLDNKSVDNNTNNKDSKQSLGNK